MPWVKEPMKQIIRFYIKEQIIGSVMWFNGTGPYYGHILEGRLGPIPLLSDAKFQIEFYAFLDQSQIYQVH